MPSIPALQNEMSWAETHPKSTLTKLNLESNVGSIPSSNLDWLRPLPSTATDQEIRQEFKSKGVVHIKGVMPKDLVLSMRKFWFETVAYSGILKEGTDPVDGIFVGGDVNTDDFVGPDNAGYVGRSTENCEHARLALEAQNSEHAVSFCQNQHLIDMVKRIEPGWTDPFILRRHLLRSNVPFAKGTSTGVHYDQIFLRAGPPTTLTAWVPIGDCGPQTGGLMYLEDSVRLGEEFEKRFERMCEDKGMSREEKLSAFNQNMFKQGMLSVDAGKFAAEEGHGRRWLIGDYEAGDAVFHHSYMIHASGANRDTSGRIRFSADLRFADRQQDHDSRWNQGPYYVGDGL